MEADKTMEGQTDGTTEQTPTTDGRNDSPVDETNERTADLPTGGQGSADTDNGGQGTSSHLDRLRNYYGDFSTADSPPMDWSQDGDAWRWRDAEQVGEVAGGEEGEEEGEEAGEMVSLVTLIVRTINYLNHFRGAHHHPVDDEDDE